MLRQQGESAAFSALIYKETYAKNEIHMQLYLQMCQSAEHWLPYGNLFCFHPHSMPYAQVHYPFENKKEFEDSFPANFIAEGIDQTRDGECSQMKLKANG